MAAKIDPAKLDDTIRLYLAGKPINEIIATTGVTRTSLHRERKRRGIPTRFETADAAIPFDQILLAYESGASEYALGRQYGISREMIRKRLIQAGVEPRGRSQAGTIRVANMTPDERKLQAAAANRAARMRTTPHIDKLRKALLNELAGVEGSNAELYVATMLENAGLEPIRQRAIGVYNVDLAMLPVAVEILGGGWHSAKATHAERIPYILDEGWNLVMVWDYEGRSAIGQGAAEYLVSFTEEVRRNPPATSQYRVITGKGELLAARGREDNEFPLVPPPRGRID